MFLLIFFLFQEKIHRNETCFLDILNSIIGFAELL